MGKEPGDIAYKRNLEDIIEEEEADREVHMVKRVYKDEVKKLDMGNRRSTDMKASRRVIFPPGRPVKEEAKIETRIGIWKEVIEKYIREKTEEGGKQSVNLDSSQKRGREKINKRVMNREIHVSPSDKGKGIVVMPLTMYSKLVEDHTSKDKEVSWDELEDAQKMIRSHSRSIGKK